MDAVKFHTSHSAELSPTGPKLWEIMLRSWQVDRLSCQNPKPANSEAILFLVVNYVHVIFLHGG